MNYFNCASQMSFYKHLKGICYHTLGNTAMGHSKMQTLQRPGRPCRLYMQTVQTEYLFFPFLGEILISQNTNVNKQDRVLLLLLSSRFSETFAVHYAGR